MKRLIAMAMLFMLALTLLPAMGTASAQGTSQLYVKSVYTINAYGFATINESVSVENNGTSAIQVPSVTIGFGNLSSSIVAANVTSGFSIGSPPSPGGPFTVTSAQSIQAGANVTFALAALVSSGVVSTAKNGTLEVLTLSSPSINLEVSRILNVVQMPTTTLFVSSPLGLAAHLTGSNNNYSAVSTDVTPAAVTSVRAISPSSQDFNPLHVFSAQRTITVSSNGTPVVTDEVDFENLGTAPLAQIVVSLLAPPTASVTIVTATRNEPVLQRPFTVSLTGGAIDLSSLAVGYPSNGVQAGTDFKLTYQYPLGSKYYSVSGGQVTLNIPDSPPVSAFADSYNITLSLTPGAKVVQGAPARLSSVTPWQTGTTTFAYTLTAGWFLDGGIPVASLVFVLLLLGLFAARTASVSAGGEEEEAEETSSEQASSMINAFDEKTSLINGFWQEVEAKDPNELDKAYFDGLRARLDAFRSKALTRLNEVRQKSTSQKFSDVVNQIQATEREVDRAAKDKLNLYQQYYLKQMRKEVFDRLLPQYTKRLERALNQLSDELHTVQREAKLL